MAVYLPGQSYVTPGLPGLGATVSKFVPGLGFLAGVASLPQAGGDFSTRVVQKDFYVNGVRHVGQFQEAGSSVVLLKDLGVAELDNKLPVVPQNPSASNVEDAVKRNASQGPPASGRPPSAWRPPPGVVKAAGYTAVAVGAGTGIAIGGRELGKGLSGAAEGAKDLIKKPVEGAGEGVAAVGEGAGKGFSFLLSGFGEGVGAGAYNTLKGVSEGVKSAAGPLLIVGAGVLLFMFASSRVPRRR